MAFSSPSFDRFVAIDWSGARQVQTRAIAVAEVKPDDDEVRLLSRPFGECWSRQAVFDWLVVAARTGREKSRRTLVGIDANFSYAAEFITEQLPIARSASDLWLYLERLSGGSANYYASGIWEHADMARHYWHQGSRPTDFRRHARRTELVCGKTEHVYPESPFKLIGAKQVGKGGLSVMRFCHALRSELGADLAIWPFDDAAKTAEASLVLVEIFPRLFINRAQHGAGKIRLSEHLDDALRVFETRIEPTYRLTDHDADAIIAAAGMRQTFRKTGLPEPSADLAERIRLEGWIFGLAFLQEEH